MEYENQCNNYAQEVRVASEANSSHSLKTFEGRIGGLAAELMRDKLKSKLQEEDIHDMHIKLEDRDGQLLQMQTEEADVQAPIEMTPPGLPLPNGFHSGNDTAVGAGQHATGIWLSNRMGKLKRHIA